MTGRLIAFAGLPSCGKSTTAYELGKIIAATTYLEPEEDKWPELIKCRAQYGYFTALSWFRMQRTIQLIDADEIRRQGRTAIVDSYYDVIVSKYIGETEFEWLIDRRDRYFDVAHDMARADWIHLPKADVLVFIRISEADWGSLMTSRGRDFDRSAQLSSNFNMQGKMLKACQAAADAHKTKLVIVDQELSTPMMTARRALHKISDV